MSTAFNIYSMIVKFWYLISIIMIVYIYKNCIQQYKYISEKKHFDKDIKKLSNYQLSLLMYKKTIPEVLTVALLSLIEKKYIMVEEDEGTYYLYVNIENLSKLSNSDKLLLEMINRMMEGKPRISLEQIKSYSNNKTNAIDLLLNYEIYEKMIRNENEYIPFFESKTAYYANLAAYKAVANVIFVAAITFSLFKHFDFFGYFIIVVSYIVNELFLKSCKRTKESNELYYDYLAYKEYLESLTEINEEKQKDYAYIGILLKANNISLLLKDQFPIELNEAIVKCVKKALEYR